MENYCEKCVVLKGGGQPLSWTKIINRGCVNDLSGGTEWQQFECSDCKSIKNIKYRDTGISRSSWFFKNEFPNYLGQND
ncbi:MULTISPECIES: hypothetical protein [Acinetobacter]|uniref:hypothetical protein n=1 Tax=Acinetobacter TaxID=469 RepID=UPI0021CD2277|nr:MULTISPECIES: hypothetical protein [Acinetobacter]MCU4366950.1 hypothetical protein [Acinetobacter courvalinii]MCU4445155.1 hypothetical protein [Acinetobacter courvalinii]MCU4568623.1 hypothetical protein [Acinetobacter radioresistens]